MTIGSRYVFVTWHIGGYQVRTCVMLGIANDEDGATGLVQFGRRFNHPLNDAHKQTARVAGAAMTVAVHPHGWNGNGRLGSPTMTFWNCLGQYLSWELASAYTGPVNNDNCCFAIVPEDRWLVDPKLASENEWKRNE